jgi:putative ABC transport system permease protein
MLGIVIGIASVILLMSLGRSAQERILNEVRDVGSNLLFIIPGATKSSREASAQDLGIVIKSLNDQDITYLKRDPAVVGVTPEVRGQARAVYQNNDTKITFIGINQDYFSVRNTGIARGVKFLESDVRSGSRIAILGQDIAKTLFGQEDPLGKNIRLKDISFRVVGIIEEKGIGAFGINQDELVLIPAPVAQKQLLGIDYYNTLSVQGSDLYTSEYIKERVTQIMRESNRITDPTKDDFTVFSQQDLLSLIGNLTGVLTMFLTLIASISLVVGGIGIMNIMLVTVTERTKEIGLRKALGATNKDITLQFLVEAVIITCIGGVIGIALGAFLVAAAYLAIVYGFKQDWVFALPASAVLIAVCVAVSTGLLFGYYPARKAALKNPIDALRYE